MEYPVALYIFLPVQLAVTVSALVYVLWKRLKLFIAVLPFVVPLIAAVVMCWFFLIKRSGTVRQLSDSPGGGDYWSMWADLWPVFMLSLLVSGLVSVIWIAKAISDKQRRAWLPLVFMGLCSQGLAFWAVGSNFPTA